MRSGLVTCGLVMVLVALLQPIYFLTMANLDHVVSADRTWSHVRDAFDAGVLSSGKDNNQIINSGDRFTDCYSLGLGLKPGASAVERGIVGARPASDRDACDDLRDAASGSAEWAQYARYWHGYRVYSAPLASVVPILALKLINLALLAGATALFLVEAARLIGRTPTLLLCAPVLFCSDFIKIWHVTPHTVSTVVIVGGAALFARAIRTKASNRTLILIAAALGSVFNFVDFLVNPPWQPMLLAFFLIAAGRRPIFALVCVGVWFGSYSVTWASKWLAAMAAYPDFSFRHDVLGTAIFRISGDYQDRVSHVPFAATLKVAQNALLSWGMIVAIPLAIFLRIRLVPAFRLAWPVLIPIAWFELLSNHSQIHASFVSRSMAAAFGVALASSLLVDRPMGLIARYRAAHARWVAIMDILQHGSQDNYPSSSQL